MTGYLQIVWADDARNRFVTLGGAGFTTMRETRQRFAGIPAASEGDLILDLCNERGILDDKYVSRATAEALLGNTFDNLVAAAEASDE